ncbi:NUDIX domain-containing protein [Streptomyces tricolor]|nr:NUDIX domain-containing protein [Streptomyces tricolor]
MARGDRAAVLPYCPARGTVVLTSQFRVPAFLHGRPDGRLLEVPGGLLDADDAGTAVRREAEEETGFRIGELREGVRHLSRPPAEFRTDASVRRRVRPRAPRLRRRWRRRGRERTSRCGNSLDEALDEVLSRPAADAKTLLLLLYLRPLCHVHDRVRCEPHADRSTVTSALRTGRAKEGLDPCHSPRPARLMSCWPSSSSRPAPTASAMCSNGSASPR